MLAKMAHEPATYETVLLMVVSSLADGTAKQSVACHGTAVVQINLHTRE